MDMVDDYEDEEEYFEDDETEYMIEDIQADMQKQYKKDYLIRIFQKFDYDYDEIIKFLWEKEEERVKK